MYLCGVCSVYLACVRGACVSVWYVSGKGQRRLLVSASCFQVGSWLLSGAIVMKACYPRVEPRL